MLNRLKSFQIQGKLDATEASFARVVQEAPRQLHAWLGLSYCASLKGDPEGALRSAETAVAIGPADDDGIIACSKALSHLGRPDAARRLLAAHPESLRLQIALGELEEQQGRTDLALGCYSAASGIDPKADLPLRKLISLHRRKGDFAAAHAAVDRLAAIDKRQEIAAWHLRGQIHSATGDREAAIAAMRTCLEGAPQSEACIIDLARELRQLRRLDDARDVLAGSPSTYGLLLALSDHELSCRNHAAALHHAAAAQALEPRKPDALMRMARIECDRGNHAAAQVVADQMAACGPDHRLTALRCRLDAFSSAGEKQEALRILQEMAALQPADAGIMADLARQYRAVGDGAAARRTLEAALARQPEIVATLTEAAEQANAREDRPTALAYFRRILAIAPDHVGHHLRVARRLYDLGELEEADRIYREAEARFGRTVEVRGERIRLLRETGEPHQALEEARAAHAAYPANFGRWICLTWN